MTYLTVVSGGAGGGVAVAVATAALHGGLVKSCVNCCVGGK